MPLAPPQVRSKLIQKVFFFLSRSFLWFFTPDLTPAADVSCVHPNELFFFDLFAPFSLLSPLALLRSFFFAKYVPESRALLPQISSGNSPPLPCYAFLHAEGLIRGGLPREVPSLRLILSTPVTCPRHSGRWKTCRDVAMSATTSQPPESHLLSEDCKATRYKR